MSAKVLNNAKVCCSREKYSREEKKVFEIVSKLVNMNKCVKLCKGNQKPTK